MKQYLNKILIYFSKAPESTLEARGNTSWLAIEITEDFYLKWLEIINAMKAHHAPMESKFDVSYSCTMPLFYFKDSNFTLSNSQTSFNYLFNSLASYKIGNYWENGYYLVPTDKYQELISSIESDLAAFQINYSPYGTENHDVPIDLNNYQALNHHLIGVNVVCRKGQRGFAVPTGESHIYLSWLDSRVNIDYLFELDVMDEIQTAFRSQELGITNPFAEEVVADVKFSGDQP